LGENWGRAIVERIYTFNAGDLTASPDLSPVTP
jgi:hypothetical protein